MGRVELLGHLAVRNVIRQRRRTAAALLAVAFGVAAIIVSGGFVRDIFRQLGEAIIRSQTGHLQIAKPEFFTSGSRSPERHLMENPEHLVAALSALPEVVEVMARIRFSGLLGNGRSDFGVLVEGIEPAKEARLGTYVRVLQGRRLVHDDALGLMAGEGVAQSLALAAGAPVSLVTATAAGSMNALDFETTAVVQSFSREYDARVVKIPLRAAQELLDVAGVNVLVVVLKDTAASDRVASELRALVARSGLEVRVWHELSDFYAKAVALYQRQFGVLQLIILVMVALSVINSLNLTLFERTAEFGTMRALGNRGGDVLRQVMTEGVVLGFAGAAVGVAVGLGLATVISAMGIPMPPPPNSNLPYVARIAVTADLVAEASAVGLIAAALGAAVPAWRVSRMPLVDALRASAH